jgi:hypothetical protein
MLIILTKKITLPEAVSADLTSVKEELASITRKPFSEAMAISILISVYRAHLSEPCARDAFRQRMANGNFMSPEEFEKTWDNPKPKTGKSKGVQSLERPSSASHRTHA